MPSTLDKSPDRPERAPEAAGGDLVKRLRGGMPLCEKAADEIERLAGDLAECRGDLESHKWAGDRVKAAEAELERTQAILTEVWVAATRARNALHAHNRPRFPAKLRTEVRDILDKALENSNG